MEVLFVTDIMILLLLAVAVGFGVRSAIQHFRGKGGCCGGGDYKPRKKKLEQVAAKKTMCISGMSCEHCQNRVMEALNNLEGVSAVVSFRKGTAVVSMERMVEDGVLKAAVEKAGYMVTEIR